MSKGCVMCGGPTEFCQMCGSKNNIDELKSTPEPSEWPRNWRDLYDKCPKCDRCGTVHADKLYCLNEYIADLVVCRNCSNDYHRHVKQFVDDVRKLKQERENGRK